jgi:hypothetical protein
MRARHPDEICALCDERKKVREQITQERLRELLNYDPSTGDLTWKKVRRKNRMGTVAGCINNLGYRIIALDRKKYLCHRLVWLYVYGVWPQMIDHINRNKADNRIENLRECTAKQNIVNRVFKGRSGLRGTYWHRQIRKWVANISINYKTVVIGNYDTAEEAHAAYLEVARRLHGDFVPPELSATPDSSKVAP